MKKIIKTLILSCIGVLLITLISYGLNNKNTAQPKYEAKNIVLLSETGEEEEINTVVDDISNEFKEIFAYIISALMGLGVSGSVILMFVNALKKKLVENKSDTKKVIDQTVIMVEKLKEVYAEIEKSNNQSKQLLSEVETIKQELVEFKENEKTKANKVNELLAKNYDNLKAEV